jgi:hypothetical protein
MKILIIENYRSSESHEDYDEEDSTSQPDSLDDDHPAHERVKAIYSSPFSPHTPYANENFRMFEAPQRLVYKSEFITPPARGRHEKHRCSFVQRKSNGTLSLFHPSLYCHYSVKVMFRISLSRPQYVRRL